MLSKISFNNLNNQVLAKLVEVNVNPSFIKRLPQQFLLNAVATVTATGGLVQNTIELAGRTVLSPVALIPSQKIRATFNKPTYIETAKKVAGFVAAIITSLLGIVGLSGLNARIQFKFGTSATEPKAPVRQIAELKRRVEALEARPAAAPVDLSEIEGRLDALEGRAPAALVDLSGIESRLAALEARPVAAPAEPVDLSVIEGRLAALEGIAPAAPVDLSGLESRVTDLTAALEQSSKENAELRKDLNEALKVIAQQQLDVKAVNEKVSEIKVDFDKAATNVKQTFQSHNQRLENLEVINNIKKRPTID